MSAGDQEETKDGEEEQAGDDAEQEQDSVAMISLDDGGEDFEDEAMDQSQLNASAVSATSEKNAEATGGESSEVPAGEHCIMAFPRAGPGFWVVKVD